jgi:hypothetical protein
VLAEETDSVEPVELQNRHRLHKRREDEEFDAVVGFTGRDATIEPTLASIIGRPSNPSVAPAREANGMSLASVLICAGPGTQVAVRLDTG